MKYLLYCFMLLYSLQTLQAQPTKGSNNQLGHQAYQEIVKPDTTLWYFAHNQLAGTFIDTIYAGQRVGEWVELYYRGTFFNNEKMYAGKIKTSPSNDKAWYVPSGKQDSMLIFDLSLEQGDSFYFPQEETTGKVDTVFYNEGKKIVEFDATEDYWQVNRQFIEGVGPNMSFIYAWSEPGILSPFIVCQFENSSLMYSSGHPYFEDCTLSAQSIKEGAGEKLHVYPNPFNEYIIIDCPGSPAAFHIQISDLNGRVHTEKQLNHKSQIDVSSLKAGIYILDITNDQINTSLKLIKR